MGDDEEFILDDDSDVDEDYAGVGDDNSDDDENNEDDSSVTLDADGEIEQRKVDASAYEGKISKNELQMILAYDDIVRASKVKDSKGNDAQDNLEVVISKLLSANPTMTSPTVVAYTISDMFNKQGRNRMVNSKYTPDTMLSGYDTEEDEEALNNEYSKAAKDVIARFIDYLANRDLSKDSVSSKMRKLRHIPAFIIFLFSSGAYDLIIDCPTMPKEYADQITAVFKKIEQMKYDLVEELARAYEDAGRPNVAARVRKLQLRWFDKEPADIRTFGELSDLDITYKDVEIYRQIRPKFTNISKSITQGVISDLIDVVIDKEAGTYKKLKDKTRTEAIIDVKKVFADWCKENVSDESITKKVLFGEN